MTDTSLRGPALGKYMTADELPPTSARTKQWQITDSHGGALGRVRWYSGWRQYVFHPNVLADPVFNPDCLDEIARFVRARTVEHRARLYADR